jgi:hypothetical protein
MPPTKNGNQPETAPVEQKSIFGPRKRPTKEQIERFEASTKKVQEEMAAAGVTEEELVAEFERLRKLDRQRSRT